MYCKIFISGKDDKEDRAETAVSELQARVSAPNKGNSFLYSKIGFWDVFIIFSIL